MAKGKKLKKKDLISFSVKLNGNACMGCIGNNDCDLMSITNRDNESNKCGIMS